MDVLACYSNCAVEIPTRPSDLPLQEKKFSPGGTWLRICSMLTLSYLHTRSSSQFGYLRNTTLSAYLVPPEVITWRPESVETWGADWHYELLCPVSAVFFFIFTPSVVDHYWSCKRTFSPLSTSHQLAKNISAVCNQLCREPNLCQRWWLTLWRCSVWSNQ